MARAKSLSCSRIVLTAQTGGRSRLRGVQQANQYESDINRCRRRHILGSHPAGAWLARVFLVFVSAPWSTDGLGRVVSGDSAASQCVIVEVVHGHAYVAWLVLLSPRFVAALREVCCKAVKSDYEPYCTRGALSSMKVVGQLKEVLRAIMAARL